MPFAIRFSGWTDNKKPLCSTTNASSSCQTENSIQQPHHWNTRSQAAQPPSSRPLSSADEAGPAPKRPRSTVRQGSTRGSSKPSKSDEPVKKARPGLTFANFFSSSSGRRSQPATSSKTATGAAGKSGQSHAVGSAIPPRRSTRLLSGTANKSTHLPKVGLSLCEREGV
jgi:anaphase-promoting complex subunit 3